MNKSYLRYLGHLKEKPREPERDFSPPPPHPVVWVVADRLEVSCRTAVAQTAYRAWEIAGVTRDGQRIPYSECVVFISERLTEQMKKLNGKSNGKSNGRQR